MSSECHQSVFRVCSECVQSVLNIEVISSSSASSVSIFGIFLLNLHPYLVLSKMLAFKRQIYVREG